MSSARIRATEAQASLRSRSVSGVTGSEPAFTAFASCLRILGEARAAKSTQNPAHGFMILDRLPSPRLARGDIVTEEPPPDVSPKAHPGSVPLQPHPFLERQAQGEGSKCVRFRCRHSVDIILLAGHGHTSDR